MNRLAAALAAALALLGCEPPPTAELSAEPPFIEASLSPLATLSAVMPTDLQLRADGGFDVLDGYAGHLWRFDAEGAPQGSVGELATWGRPVRMLPDGDGGYWLATPGSNLDVGALLQVDRAGAVKRTLMLEPEGEGSEPFSPVALSRIGDRLAVADRAGWVGLVDLDRGALAAVWEGGAPDAPFGLITDLAAGEDGRLWATDVLNGHVYKLGSQGPLPGDFGGFGFWAGALYRPRATASVGDAVLVADSGLGAVQVFGKDGRFRGVLAHDGAPLHLEHPTAIRADRAGNLLVLDAATATVSRVTLAAGALDDPGEGPRRLRYTLVADPAGLSPDEGCVQCHDGFVNDDRAVWDPALLHHPRHFEEPVTLPDLFPREENGDLSCSTCHSPHGTVSVEDARATKGAEAVSALRRAHGSARASFGRVALGDGSLCRACHGETPHEDAAARVGLGGTAHPAGADLAKKLQDRGEQAVAELMRGDCESCHAPHGAVSEPLLRDSQSSTLCAGCHAAQASAGDNHPLLRKPGSKVAHLADLTEVRGSALGCRSCHDLVGGSGAALLREREGGGLLCLACHPDKERALQGEHHGLKGHAGIGCLSCHDVHGQPVAKDMLRNPASKADPGGCLTCHSKGSAGAHPGAAGHPVTGEALTRADGSAEHLTCLACHDAHAAAPPAADDCLSCHADQAQEHAAGGHGGLACLDCHDAHADPPLAARASNPAAARCLACHGQGASGDATRVAAFQHPAAAFLPDGKRWSALAGLALYGPDGQPVSGEEEGALVCQSCHATHGPQDENLDHLRKDGWKPVCSACHGQDALVLYRYFHDPRRWPGEKEATP